MAKPGTAVYPSVTVRGGLVSLERSAAETVVVNPSRGTYSVYYYSAHGQENETHGTPVTPALQAEIADARRQQAQREGIGLGG